MVVTGGLRVLVGALLLSAGVVAPATASADPAYCDRWDQIEVPVPDGVASSGFAAVAGEYAVGNGSYKWASGSAVLIWKGGQLVDRLHFDRNPARADDVNSSGAVILTASLFPAASRWQAGVYTALKGWQGEYRVKAIDINERGDVLGTSEGKPVVWPAGSGEPRLVPGTDASWSALGITDDGTVLAGSSTGVYWLGESGAVRLESDAGVEVRAVSNSYAVGRSGDKIERWDRQGQPSGGFTGATDALDVNSQGHLLGKWDNHTTVGATGVWYDTGYFSHVSSGGLYLGVITDEGDLYGAYYDGRTSTPAHLRCADGV